MIILADLNIEEVNKKIENPIENINKLKGFEIIAETLVLKIFDVYGRNTLLNILYQIGSAPGEAIAKRIKIEYEKDDFEVLECIEVLMKELKEFYSMKINQVEDDDQKIRFLINNHCFIRESIKHREKLEFGKALCRVNKGYFETALKNLAGNKIKKVEINFLENDEENDACLEEVIFYKA